MTENLARRTCVHKLTPAELAIRRAMDEVEKLPADVRLTDAVTLLDAAGDSVADYVDNIHGIRRGPDVRTSAGITLSAGSEDMKIVTTSPLYESGYISDPTICEGAGGGNA